MSLADSTGYYEVFHLTFLRVLRSYSIVTIKGFTAIYLKLRQGTFINQQTKRIDTLSTPLYKYSILFYLLFPRYLSI